MKNNFDYSKLQGLIKEKCKTNTEFATKLGISRAWLSQIMNGKAVFDQNTIQKSIAILGIPTELIGTYFFETKVFNREQF